MKNFIHNTHQTKARYLPSLYNLLPLFLAFSFMLSALSSSAQTRVTGPLISTSTTGQYFNYNNGSVVFGPGFTSAPTSGQSFQAYITPSEAIPITLNLTHSLNFILTSVPRISGITDTSQLHDRTTAELMQSVQYIDGLGRPLQTVQVEGSPNGNDVVQPFAYDIYGREVAKYLPYVPTTGNDGSYRTSAISTQASFYSASPSGVLANSYPFDSVRFEPSPLNRPVEQGAPGATWQLTGSGVSGSGHTVKMGYGLNPASEEPLWLVTSGGASWGSTYYSAGTLYADTIADENGHKTIEYKDKVGKVVCKKAQLGTSWLATSYVYDDMERLAYVIPPIPAGTTYPTSFGETDAVFTNFIYGYHYDGRNRLVEKKIPGKGWEFMIYNPLDQVVFTQDANQRAQSIQVWTVTKYDALGRVAMTNLWAAGGVTGGSADTNRVSPSRTLRNWLLSYEVGVTSFWLARDNSTTTGYEDVDPMGTILTVNHYDDYSIPGLPSGYSAPSGVSVMTHGLITATQTNVLGTTDMLWAVHYYDDLGRNIKSYMQHYLGGTLSAYNYDAITTTYDFTNAQTTTKRQHFNTTTTGSTPLLTVTNQYIYDHIGRKLKTWETINNGSGATGTRTLLSQTEYNEVGQVLNKHIHSTDSLNYLQNIAYSYNERGWLRTGTSSLFSLDLRYNTPDAGTANYNGNIAEMHYAGQYSNKVFDYTYDALNRLKLASAGSGNALNEAIVYDNLGNIDSLTRGTLSPLIYAYTGNQLTGVSGYTNRSYGYDGNGNATTDGATGNPKTINYNMLNLPQSLTQSGSTIATYTYDALGAKLRTTSTADSTWDYASGITYRNGSLAYVQTEEGRAVYNGTNYLYQYDLKDHLGNNRVIFDKDASGNARELQEDEYCAFGLRGNLFGSNNSNRYLYNGKEIQVDLANQYDYGARLYDPVIARWTSVDPLAEKSRRWSPYNYVMNNPMGLMDINGMQASYNWETSKYEDNGKEVSWDNVQKQYGIGVYADKTVDDQNNTQAQQQPIAYKPLTKTDFLTYVQSNLCPNCRPGQLQDRAGKEFERLFEEFIKKYFVETKLRVIKTGVRNIFRGLSGNSIPDYIGISYTFPEAEPLVSSAYSIESLWELKATKNNIGIGSFDGQIRIQIEAAKLAGIPELILITTWGVKLSQPLQNFAEQNNILLTHYWTQYSIGPTGMSLMFKPAEDN